MKRFGLPATTLVCLLLLAAPEIHAQMPGGSLNAALTRLFGADAAFTANADVQVLDKARQESARMPMKFSVLGEKLRVDTDLTRMKSRELLTEVVAEFRREGLERISSVIRPYLQKPILLCALYGMIQLTTDEHR